MIKIIDISLPIFNEMPVYPGNQKTFIKVAHSKNSRSQLSEIKLSSHAGTHIDAPKHVFDKGLPIDQLPLETFYGSCRVLDLTKYKVNIPRSALEKANIKPGERIILKTQNSYGNFSVFDKNYIYLSPGAATYLSERNVRLVGIDALSIKQRGSKDNSPHELLLSKNIPILEGLVLSAVSPGSYMLVAFPLALCGIDGSPCRAILFSS